MGGGIDGGADTSPTSLIVHLWIYTAPGSCLRNTTVTLPHAILVLSDYLRSFVLRADVTGSYNVVDVTSPQPCARLPQNNFEVILSFV
jgi:hypothetical protein